MGWSGKYGASLTIMAPYPDLPSIDGLLIVSEGLREDVEPIFQNHHQTQAELARERAKEIIDEHKRNDGSESDEKSEELR